MAIKSIGLAALALGLVLVVIGLAQPTTVTDSSTTCIDSTYLGPSCSTVEYERSNPLRANLLGFGGFLLFGGLIAYGIGQSRPSGTSELSTTRSENRNTSADTNTTTAGPSESLGEKLAAHQSETAESGVESGNPSQANTEAETRSVHDSVPLSKKTDTAPTAGTLDQSGVKSADTSGWNIKQHGMVALSGLTCAILLSFLFSLVATTRSIGVASILFTLCSAPGMVLYWRYKTNSGTADTESIGGQD